MTVKQASVGVVGAGPAGAAAALVLARAGCRVELIDRRPFPRDKACGDALTAPALHFLDELGLDWIRSRTLTLRGSRIHPDLFGSFEAPTVRDDVVHMIRRSEFDAMVRDAALDAGAIEREARVLGVRLDDHGGPMVAIESASGDLEELRFGHVIGADGAGSVVARDLDLHPGYGTHAAWSMRTYVDGGRWEPTLELVDSSVLDLAQDRGFGWLLPVSEDGANVGVYVHGADGARWVPRALDRLLEALTRKRLTPADARTTRRAGWIRHDFHPSRSVRGRVLLAGDAVGLSSAVTGEGIGLALGSGIRAAEAILSHIGDGTPLTRYGLALDEQFGGWVRRSRRSVDRGTTFALPRDQEDEGREESRPAIGPTAPFGPGIVVVQDDGGESSPLVAELGVHLQDRADLLTRLDRMDARRWGLPIEASGDRADQAVVGLIAGDHLEWFDDSEPAGVGMLLDRLESALIEAGRPGF